MATLEHDTNGEAFELTDMDGIRVMVGHGDRSEVMRKAMVDLKTTIEGCQLQAPSRDTFDALARQCSIFLRKMALGDDRNPPLLNSETCKAAGIQFHKLKPVGSERQRAAVVELTLTSSKFQATLTHPDTGELLGEMSQGFDDPWEFSILADWPLPGITGWLGKPTRETPWKIGPEELFDLRTTLGHDCSRWLEQQLVLFDNQSVTLGSAIRALINAEGAHAPTSVLLMQDSNARARPDTIRNPGAYILLSMVTGSFTYSHLIAVEAGLYLYLLVAQSGLVEQFKDVDSIPGFQITGLDAVSPSDRPPLGFEGGIAPPIGNRPGGQQETHTIRAPRPR